MLTKKQISRVTEKQKTMQQRFRSVSNNGRYVEYLGKQFVVYKDVFWPFDDSKPLVEHFKINSNDYVLDACTGSGVIAIFSIYKGAKRVVALDINYNAVKAARANAELHGFSNLIDVRLSNMFEALRDDEQFDVITANLPFRNLDAVDDVEATMWDESFKAHKKFFKDVKKYLKLGGRIYLSQANFGEVDEVKQLARESGFTVKLIGQRTMSGNDPRIFYAFELTRG